MTDGQRSFIFVVVIFIVLIGFATTWLSGRSRSGNHARSHAVARTKVDLQNSALAIQLYAGEYSELPEPFIAKTNSIVDSKGLYSSLFGSGAKDFWIGDPSPHWKSSGQIVDRWGKPISFRVISKDNGSFYRIRGWSNGPDGVDDSGTGDDITKEFEVSF